jgi:hypothetical protein
MRDNAARHCERSEAIHARWLATMDCRVALLLAMTKLWRSSCVMNSGKINQRDTRVKWRAMDFNPSAAHSPKSAATALILQFVA